MPDFPHFLADPWFALRLSIVVGTMLLAGFIRGFVGFGGALIVVSVLTVIVGPLAAVPLAAMTGLPSTFQLLPAAVRFSERSFVLPISVATFLGAPLGAWALISTDPRVMKVVISLLVLVMVGVLARGWRFANTPSAGALFATGLWSGLVQGSSGVGGPPVVAVALARGGVAERQRANVVGAITAVSLSSVVPLWYHGLFTIDVVVMGLVLIPLYSGGTWLGARFFSREGEHYFRIAALLTLAVIGTTTFAFSIRDFVVDAGA